MNLPAEMLLRQAAHAFNTGDYAIAEQRAASALKENLTGEHLPTAYEILGRARLNVGNLADAVEPLASAVAGNQNSGHLRATYALALRCTGNKVAAVDAVETALRLAPNDPYVRQAGAVTFTELGRIDEALALIDGLLRERPDDAELLSLKGEALLSVGRFAEGWPLYGNALRLPVHSEVSGRFSHPEWDGRDLPNGTLLVWTDKGIGDQIMQFGLFKTLKPKVGHMVLACQDRLRDLLARSDKDIEVVSWDDPRAHDRDIDAQTGVARAAQFAINGETDFPGHRGYLKPPEDLTASLRARYLDAAEGKPLVGIAWRSANAKIGAAKDVPLDAWGPVLSQQDCGFISLQYGDQAAERTAIEHALGVSIYEDKDLNPFGSMDAAAAQVAAVDYVITVSNSVVHLAGAFAKPTAMLAPTGFGRHWYWTLGRSQSLWYPEVSLFDQAEDGSWESAIYSAAEWLKNEVSKSAA